MHLQAGPQTAHHGINRSYRLLSSFICPSSSAALGWVVQSDQPRKLPGFTIHISSGIGFLSLPINLRSITKLTSRGNVGEFMPALVCPRGLLSRDKPFSATTPLLCPYSPLHRLHRCSLLKHDRLLAGRCMGAWSESESDNSRQVSCLGDPHAYCVPLHVGPGVLVSGRWYY